MNQETLPSTLDVIARTEIDMQIATAKRYPRNVQEFSSRTKQVALSDRHVAESCYYTLERKESRTGQKRLIQGPSIRLLEIAAAQYGNIRCGARIVSDHGRWVVAQGVAHDLESNLFVTTEVMRPIVTREGRRYSDDMVSVTANAACSIAKRNALLGVIPRQMVEAIMQECMDTVAKALKSEGKIAQRWATAVGWFGERGVAESQLLAYLSQPEATAVTADDIATLRGIKTALEDGEAALADYFPAAGVPDPGSAQGADRPPASPTDTVTAKVRARRQQQEREPGAEG